MRPSCGPLVLLTMLGFCFFSLSLRRLITRLYVSVSFIFQRSYTTPPGFCPVLTCTVCIWSVLIPLGVGWASTAWPGTTRYSNTHWWISNTTRVTLLIHCGRMGIFRDATVVVCFADLVSSCCFQSTKVKVIPVTSLLWLNMCIFCLSPFIKWFRFIFVLLWVQF